LAQSTGDSRWTIPAVDQEQVVSYWTIEGGWSSELQLRNNIAGKDLVVTPVLRSASGEEASLPPISIRPDEVKAVDIRSAIETYAPGFSGTYGSVALRYHSIAFHNLYAAMMVHDTGHPIAFHIDAIGHIEEFEGASREGIWWLPNDTAKDILVLTNQGGKPLDLTLLLYDAQGKHAEKRVPLAPLQTMRYSMRSLVADAGLGGNYGGFQVRAANHAGSLDTLHVVYDEGAGFSAMLKMFDHDPKAKVQERDFAGTSSWTTRAPMLALSDPDPALNFPSGTVLQPQLFIRNTAANTRTARLAFNWRSDAATGKSTGPTLKLQPFETRRLDVAALQNGTTLPKDAHWTSVTLATDAQPDEVMAVAASYDATLRYGAQTPFSDQLSHEWEGGQWEYDAMHDSIITAGNGGSKPTTAAFTIFYDGARKKYELEQPLQPGEQMWIDVGKLIRNRIPDKNGKPLPEGLESGSYKFRELSHSGLGSLFEGKVIYDQSFGHVSYGCAACCAASLYIQFLDNPLGLGLGLQGLNEVEGLNDCTNSWTDINQDFPNWKTANPAIATTTNLGLHTGMSVGSTTSSTSGYSYKTNGRNGCYEIPQQPSGPTDVLNVSVTLADITQNKITVVLSSTSGGTGQLTLQVNGPSAVQKINTGANPIAAGTYNYDFGLSTIPVGEYTTVTATWNVSGVAISGSASDHFTVLGTYKQTQYNTPAESQCAVGSETVTIWSKASPCTGANGSVRTAFDFRVTDPKTGTGSGHSISYNDVSEEFSCSVGSGDLRSPFTIKVT